MAENEMVVVRLHQGPPYRDHKRGPKDCVLVLPGATEEAARRYRVGLRENYRFARAGQARYDAKRDRHVLDRGAIALLTARRAAIGAGLMGGVMLARPFWLSR